jgi:curved DNA-binding protein CbpA
MNNHHARKILGVSATAGIEETRARFYQRAKETHPDRTGKGDASEFIRLRAAYEDLLTLLKLGDQPPHGDKAAVGDFEWEWAIREQEIRNAFERLRQEFRNLRLSEKLLGHLAKRIRAYQTVAELRARIKDDAQRIAREFIGRLDRLLHQREARILHSFNQKLSVMYSVFYHHVHEQHPSGIWSLPLFWGLVPGIALVTSPV